MARLILVVVVSLLAANTAAHAQGRTQIFFSKPTGMKVYWQTTKEGKIVFSTVPLDVPGRFNFTQGAVYQLKLTHIPGHPGLELYPTLEVVRPAPRTAEFVGHNSIPLALNEDDFKEVVERNSYLVKAVYLPSARFQDAPGTDEIASTRMEPGQDPIREATRRGDILLVLRLGTIRKE